MKPDDAVISPPAPVVDLWGVEKTYANGTRALAETTLTFREGEFISLLGPSGCGKSTLLKMIAGLTEPSNGKIRWWNRGLDEVGQPGRKMVMVFQDATLMPWARVGANVRLPLDLAGRNGPETDRAVADALKLVGLEKFERSYPRELSGGMQMRASIARALVTEPNLLLMDEPFGALDEITRNRLDGDLRELWAKKKLTVIFVTHSIYEAVYLSTRVVVMSARPGRVSREVMIDVPEEGNGARSESFRVSREFAEYCKVLSDALAEASEAPHE